MAARLPFNNSNNIYIRNLAPDITEDIVRETFKHCDEILSIQFRSYHGSTRKYCIVEFKSYTGIANGTLMNGTPMLGLPLEITVTDPVSHSYDSNLQNEVNRASIQWQYGNVANDQSEDPNNRDRLDRTIYIQNIPNGYDKSDIQTLFSNIGTIIGCCLETSAINPTISAIVEFYNSDEAKEALRLDGIAINNNYLKIEKSKLLVVEEPPAYIIGSGVIDPSLLPIADDLPVRSTTINAKLAKVLEMRERLTRKLSHQQSEADRNDKDDEKQWWHDPLRRGGRRRSYSRSESRSRRRHSSSRRRSSRRHRSRSGRGRRSTSHSRHYHKSRDSYTSRHRRSRRHSPSYSTSRSYSRRRSRSRSRHRHYRRS